jgi:adenosyl cobinamide kinase/adenosyl cobinamide phosphate guanylyltransferase
MPMTLLLGGARSGKSRLAAEMMGEHAAVGVVATAEALDEEMRLRIERHRQARPGTWTVVEEPIDLRGAMSSFPSDTPLIVDCLTLWVSNLMGAGLDEGEILERGIAAARAASARTGPTVVVSNEVGSGVVPVHAVARSYRDTLGSVNSSWAEVSDLVLLTVAGGVVPVLRPSELLGRPGDG